VEKLITITQLSDLIQVKSKTIYQWTHTGYIPHYKLPKGIRFKESDVESWLKKRLRRGRNRLKIDL